MSISTLKHPPARSFKELASPALIFLASPEDREVQIGGEEFAHDVSLGEPPTVCKSCETGDPERVFEPLLAKLSTAKISGVCLAMCGSS